MGLHSLSIWSINHMGCQKEQTTSPVHFPGLPTFNFFTLMDIQSSKTKHKKTNWFNTQYDQHFKTRQQNQVDLENIKAPICSIFFACPFAIPSSIFISSDFIKHCPWKRASQGPHIAM